MTALCGLAHKYGTDKVEPHQFTPVYDQILGPHRQTFRKIAEIGVFFGASIKMWRDYLPNAHIYGLDTFQGKQGNGEIFPNADKFWREQQDPATRLDRVFLSQTDQAQKKSLEAFAESHLEGTFDLIIDDGSHRMQDQQLTLDVLWSLVRPGGYFIMEDLHSSMPTESNFKRYDLARDLSNSTLKKLERWRDSPNQRDCPEGIASLEIFKCGANGESLTGVIRKKMILPIDRVPDRPLQGTVLVSYAAGPQMFQLCQVLQSQWARSQAVAPELLCFSRADLEAQFLAENAGLFGEVRGAGYWAWKPYVILAALLGTNAQYVVYSDACTQMKEGLAQFCARANPLAAYNLDDYCRQGRWTKRDIFLAMKMDSPEMHQALQKAATCIAFRNTPEARAFVQEWLRWCLDRHLINDDPPTQGPNLPEFVENRHDQALFSLLCYRDQIGNFLDDFSRFNHQGFWKTGPSPAPAPQAPHNPHRAIPRVPPQKPPAPRRPGFTQRRIKRR